MKYIFTTLIIIISIFNLKSQEIYTPEEVSYNLYAITDLKGGNVAFLVTRKGVVVVDAGSTPDEGKKIVATIRSITKKPIKYLILTHSHGGQINGVTGFPSDVTIIAHANLEKNNAKFNEKKLNNYKEKVLPEYLENLKLQMDFIDDKELKEYTKLKEQYDSSLAYLENIKKIKFRKPDITFEDYYRFKIADERIMLEYPGPTHTNDNILVKFSNHNVIHTGDLVFNGCFPYLIVEHGVDVYNWIKTLDDLYAENIITVIPGHGDVGRKITLKDQSDYFKSLSHKIETLKDEGYKLDAIKEKIKASDFELKGNEKQLPINIEVIYTELVNKGIEWWKF